MIAVVAVGSGDIGRDEAEVELRAGVAEGVDSCSTAASMSCCGADSAIVASSAACTVAPSVGGAVQRLRGLGRQRACAASSRPEARARHRLLGALAQGVRPLEQLDRRGVEERGQRLDQQRREGQIRPADVGTGSLRTASA